jgi:hypothetical protein
VVVGVQRKKKEREGGALMEFLQAGAVGTDLVIWLFTGEVKANARAALDGSREPVKGELYELIQHKRE